MLDPSRRKAEDRLRSGAVLASPVQRMDGMSAPRPAVKGQPKAVPDQTTNEQRAVERFERSVYAAIETYRSTVRKACVDEAKRIGLANPEAFVMSAAQSVNDMYTSKVDAGINVAGSVERARAEQLNARATGNLVQAARAVNEARYGKDGALVVEMMGAAAAVRREAARDIRVLLREEARKTEAKAPSGAEFHWSDRVFGASEHVPSGARFDEEVGSAGKSRRTASGRTTTTRPDESGLRRRAPVRDEGLTMQELQAATDESLQAMEVEGGRDPKEPRPWSIVDFMITNPCLRRTLRISEYLDRLRLVTEGPDDASFTATRGRAKKLGIIGRASQYARGAVEEAEKAGVYDKRSEWGTGTGMVVLGRILAFATVRLQMNAHASRRYDSVIEGEMRKATEETRRNLREVQETVNDAEATNSAWRNLITITDPENPNLVIPRPDTGEILGHAVYEVCGNNDGMARVAAMAASEPPATSITTGDAGVDSFLGSVFAPSQKLLAGGSSSDLQTTREAALSLNPQQSKMALGVMLRQVGRLSSANSPVVAMAGIVAEKIGVNLSTAREQVFKTNSGLESVETHVADASSSDFVGWATGNSNVWYQAAYAAFPDILSSSLVGRLANQAFPYLAAGASRLLGTDFAETVAGASGSMTSEVLGEGMAFSADTQTSLFTSALKALQNFSTSDSWVTYILNNSLLAFGAATALASAGSLLWKALGFVHSGRNRQGDNLALNWLWRVHHEITKEAGLGGILLEMMSNGGLVSVGLRLVAAILVATSELLADDVDGRAGLVGVLLKKIINSTFLKTIANFVYVTAVPVAAACFKVARIATGAYTGLFMVQQASMATVSLVAPFLASVPFAVPILAAIGIGMFLLPPDVLKNSTPMWLYNNTFGMMRVLAYRLVDPFQRLIVAALPKSIRDRVSQIGGFLGAVGNLLCTRPEIGIFAFTLVTIWAKSGSDFVWNRCLLGDINNPGTAKKNRRIARMEENAQFNRIRDLARNVSSEKLRADTTAILFRYASTICGMGEGALTGPKAYRALHQAFVSGWPPMSSGSFDALPPAVAP